MLNNLIKYSIRSFKRQRTYIIINITGLSIGIACSLLIALFVLYEASYDRFNEKKDRIFDIVMNFKIGGQEFTEATTCPPIGPTLANDFPEVEDFLRMRNVYRAESIVYDKKTYAEDNIIEADSSFFNFFSIPVLRGNPESLLNTPHKAVLSASVAKKIFGDENPVDKIIKVGRDTSDYVITGVMGDIPGNSHFAAGVVVSILSDPEIRTTQWSNNSLNTYILLRPNADYKVIDSKFPSMVASHVGPELQRFLNLSFEEFLSKGNKYGYYLQKLTDIHLDTSAKPHFAASGDPKLLKILGGIALLILLVAAVNFTNLSTAQASKRAKEVGIKKLGGSTRGMLVGQFLTESILMSFISTIVALLIIKLVLPGFNNLIGTGLTLKLSDAGYIIPFMLIFSIITGIIAGSYPAFFLSSFSPYKVLKGGTETSSHKGTLRKVLVVLQFTISICLIVGTMIMYRQIMYMIKRDPGFRKDQLLVIRREENLGTKTQPFMEALSNIPGVTGTTSSTTIPGNPNSNNGYALEGNKDETILMWTSYVDYNFLEIYGMQLKSGRFFSKEFLTDDHACIVNEAALKKFNIDPVKTRVMVYRDSGKMDYYPIIGVVKDFVFDTQRNQVAPFIFRLKSPAYNYGNITVKIAPRNYMETIRKIENAWKEFSPDQPINYSFVDDIMKDIYRKDQQNAKIAMISSLLAIFIAALGLYGLTAYTVEQRTKEIGVRKAMGSSVAGIYIGISKDIIILVSVSALLAFPVIYYLAGKWLESFYYKVSPGALTFLEGLLITMGIAILTISYRTLRASRANPAQSLRYE